MDFIFQTDFSDFTLKVLGRRFKLVEGDSIQMVIWMGHIHNLPLRDRYFVFTKQGLYWNFPAIVQSGEEGQTANVQSVILIFSRSKTLPLALSLQNVKKS